MNTFESKTLGFNAEFKYVVESNDIFVYMIGLEASDGSWISFKPVLVHWEDAAALYKEVEEFVEEDRSYAQAVAQGYEG